MVPNPVPCQPQHSATIFYNYADYVLTGNMLTREQVRNRPTVNFPALDVGANYSVLMIDADADDGNGGTWVDLKYLAVNSFEVIVDASDMVAPYESPNPMYGTHRYIWLLYKQHGRIDPKRAAYYNKNRKNFSLRKFAADNNLTVPSAGNIFRVQA